MLEESILKMLIWIFSLLLVGWWIFELYRYYRLLFKTQEVLKELLNKYENKHD